MHLNTTVFWSIVYCKLNFILVRMQVGKVREATTGLQTSNSRCMFMSI